VAIDLPEPSFSSTVSALFFFRPTFAATFVSLLRIDMAAI
jgi:hypothetical protein